MKLLKPKCPVCGASAIGTLETTEGYAEFDGDPAQGAVEYSGTTHYYDNGQQTVRRRGKPVVVCEDGHEWVTEIAKEETHE